MRISNRTARKFALFQARPTAVLLSWSRRIRRSRRRQIFAEKKSRHRNSGNTQDISCRAWLKAQGFKVTQTGGDVMVLPTANPDQLALFQKGGVDAVWTVEPWVTRLEREANGKIFLEDSNVLTTWLASSVKFLQRSSRTRQENCECKRRADAMD